MKIVAVLLTGISLIALSEQAFSQYEGVRKPLNNPLYSTHNYKHPNQAAAARRWENKAGIDVKQPALSDTRLANYKNQMPNTKPVGGVTIDHTPSASLADRNYKIQRVNQPKSSVPVNEYYVKKRKNDSTNIGD
ncbi:hypothetical protein [Spirosoma flavum]|uniref:Uncharacterized protein n=1 Tax=Spirosoma flavum TaxID=2048557 RepID=A0ABW6AHB6_9BACT